MRKALVLTLLLLLPSLASAETTGRVAGSVADEDGNPIVGAKITVSGPALQGERTLTTDESGKFLAPFLPPGDYLVAVSARDFQQADYTFRVGIGQTIPLDVAMKRGGGMVEEVTVFGTASKLETTAGGENFSSKTVDQLPIVDRDIERVAELAPNISFGPTPNTLSISGAPSFDTVVLLDGSEISDPYFGSAPDIYLEEAIEEVQVLTTAVSARYGRFQGGVINAVTKSGGNTFDGGVRADFQKESWNQKTPFGESQSTTLSKVYSATVGGPILKDRLWFFVGGRTIPTDSVDNNTAVSGQSFTTERDEDRIQIKLTGSVTPDHTIEASYFDYDATTSNRAGLPAAEIRAVGKRSDPRKIYTAEYQGILTDKQFFSLQGTKKEVSIQSGGDPAKGSPFLDDFGSGFQIWNNHWWDFEDPSVRDNDTISASLTQVLTTADWGDHTLEYGVQYVNSKTAGENRQSSTGYNLLNYDGYFRGLDFTNIAFNISDPVPGDDPFDPNDPRFALISEADGGTTYRWVALPLGGDQKLKNTALYVQDTWSKGKWRIDAGLRWEKYEGSGPEPTLNLDVDELSPRLGVTYNLDRNWQLQATWGRYVSRFNDNVASAVSGVGGAPYVWSAYTGPTTCPVAYVDMDLGSVYNHCLTRTEVEQDYLLVDDYWDDSLISITDPKQPTRFLASDIQAPYADDFNLSVKRALPKNTGTLTLTYTNRRYRKLLDDFVGDQGDPVDVVDPLFGTGETFLFDRTVWDNSDLARRDYEAVTATWDYRPSARWDFGGNWTYSFTRGNYEGEGRNTPSSGSIIGNYVRSFDQAAAIPYGFTDDDIRHRARLWGHYTLDFGRPGTLTLGGLGLYQSGLPYSLVAGVPLVDDPDYLNAPSGYGYFFDGRGNNRFGGFWRLDFMARYQVILARDVSAYVKLDILNILNNDSLIAHSTSGAAVTVNGTPTADPALDEDGDGFIDGTGVLTFSPRSSFGNARNDLDYQLPRSYFVSLGVQF